MSAASPTKILALEFSSPQRSAAVLDASRSRTGPGKDASGQNPVPYQSSFRIAEVVETGSTAARPFEMIEEALRQAQLEREQIECLAIGLGPGSYNGIRSAIAVAQGWQLASDIKLLGISSVDCLLEQARESQCAGRLHIVIDAQRNEFYVASFILENEQAHVMEPLRIVPRAAVEALQAADESLVGPQITRWFPRGQDLAPRAAALARIALSRRDFMGGDKLEPIYLRETAFVKAPPGRIIPS